METKLKQIAADRDFFNSLGNAYTVNGNVDITRELIEGVTCYWFVPGKIEHQDKIILYLHGGMFGLGSIQSHKPMVSHFADAFSTRVLFIEYALAPEKPFPNGVNDVIKVYRELTSKFPKSKISVIGDSAGGGLSVTLIKKVTEENLPTLTHVVLISPWLYLKCDTGSYQSRRNVDPILKKEQLMEYANFYVAGDWNEANPGQFVFDSFPPTLILVGSNEILFDDSRLFYEQLRPVQSNCKMKEYENQSHVWPLADINADAAKSAMTDIKLFLSDR